MGGCFADVVARVQAKAGPAGTSWLLRGPEGEVARLGRGDPAFEVSISTAEGLAAVESFNALAIAEAYMRGDIDVDGDFIQVMELRDLLKEQTWAITAWAQISPVLLGRTRLNPKWIARHYDANNVQVYGLDRDYAVYTPGIYEREDDTLEAGAARKLEAAFTSLGLGPGDSLLDVGCGWGGMVRFAAERGVDVTGITLSRHQLGYAEARLRDHGLQATILYQDFFTFEPDRRYDAVSMMGVMEDLSDYDLVMRRLRDVLKPGGRVYCDFASANRRYGVPSVVTKYIWPGKFRMVYMPQFTDAVATHGFEILSLHNDRVNYHLWTKGVHERWVARRKEILEVTDEATWRLMRMLQAAVAHSMGPARSEDTAYRLVLGRR